MSPGPSPLDPGTFHCEVAREDESARVAPFGELDIATVPILQAEIASLRATGIRRVILDLSRLDFIDSTGLRCIVHTDAEARQFDFSIALIHGPPAVRRVFELTNPQTQVQFVDP